MTPRSTRSCEHEPRPGTTVCLHCRHEKLMAARERRRQLGMKLLVRGGLVAAVVAGAVSVLKPGLTSTAQAERQVAPESTARRAAASGSFAVSQSGEMARATPATAAEPVTPSTRVPAVPAGRTDLGAGIYAERTGDTVVVHFDTPGTRTRRSDKFERVVRETLPVILGEAGQRAVEGLEPGGLVPAGQLLPAAEAPPLHLPVGDGRTIRLAPGTRPGQDGPLVVTYRAVIHAPAPSA